MNATDLLKEDHDRLKEMFDEFRGLDGGDRREKQRLFRRIASALEVHAEIEERFFYPAVRGTRREDAVEITFEAFEEHKIARTLIGQIESLPKGDPRKDAKMKVLMESVEHHIEEEEEEMFAEANDLGDDRLDELAEQMQTLEAELMRRRGVETEDAEEVEANV
ncbi:MAG TPA: hemerythrin domain-containing protein [Thermoanaerobaculia bacterium]|nr:hemerythrin domain-containing protein [Thermoanaerobaculia bacterium]